jgi:hypothetical protein
MGLRSLLGVWDDELESIGVTEKAGTVCKTEEGVPRVPYSLSSYPFPFISFKAVARFLLQWAHFTHC